MAQAPFADSVLPHAGSLAFEAEPSPAQRALLRQAHLYFLAYGSIARPMSELLVDYGATEFTLVDPKSYAQRSVASQCEPDEVDLAKVDVGRRRLCQRGAAVTAYCRDLYTVPDGAARKHSVLIVSADNPRADIGANRLAVRMGLSVLKVNIEPAYEVVAIRAFDFRRPSPVCIECSFSDARYGRQRHPNSCEGTDERPTGSPRSLSQAAGQLGAWALCALLDEQSAGRWWGRELLYWAQTGQATWSELAPNPACRCHHAGRWPALQRLASGPESISLAELARCANIIIGQATMLRFCQQVALRSRCEGCGRQVHSPRWLSALDAPTGVCPSCGGRLLAVPFYLRRELPLWELAAVAEGPLAAWGVAPAAVIELAGSTARQAFVIGSDRHPFDRGRSLSMSRMFDIKKESFRQDLQRYQSSPVMTVLGTESTEEEWRAMIAFRTKTLVKAPDGRITTAGPVVCGIRYHERFLCEAPHPFEIVTILDPDVFHPNCAPTGAMCLGHPQAALTLESILNQVWAGLNLNMKVVDTRPGHIANREAAQWVVANAHLLPLSRKGLLEEPD